jgi:hypothetical protein
MAASDPETHSVRGSLFAEQGNFAEAIIDLKRALELGPHDIELWTRLGDYCTQVGDASGAIRAYSEATRLAPKYARAHWLLGNCLLETGQTKEAFVEFRHASENRPSLFESALELAWQAYDGDAAAVEQALQPHTVKERIALGLFFGKHGRVFEGAPLLKEAGGLPKDERLALLNELLNTNRLVEAYEVWSGNGKASDGTFSATSSISNAGFEDEIVADEPGFGWQFNQGDRTVNVVIDSRGPRSGLRSLRLDWRGDSGTARSVVYQLVLAKPRSQYFIRFFARTQDLVTVAFPVVTVIEVKGRVTESLERGDALDSSSPINTSGSWREYGFAFKTSDETDAVFVVVRREQCSNSPCPAFGSLWLDDFTIEKVS